MSIPSNPIPPEEDEVVSKENSIIIGENNIPTIEETQEQDDSTNENKVPPLEDPVDETLEIQPYEETEIELAVVDSTYTDLDEPGEHAQQTPTTKPPKPAYIAILTIIGLIMLCCVMAGVMFLLLQKEILATGVL